LSTLSFAEGLDRPVEDVSLHPHHAQNLSKEPGVEIVFAKSVGQASMQPERRLMSASDAQATGAMNDPRIG
ncbi:MAG: hypothetical protein JRG92_20440, partial [Deltaproteobacteria bacterium]|nr:hypothetical protein [Deltaproteobacteria bacterium]